MELESSSWQQRNPGAAPQDSSLSMPLRYSVLGVPVSAVSLDIARSMLEEWADDRVARIVTVPDTSNIVRSQDDHRLLAIHQRADMVVPDGTPLVWIGKARGMTVSRTCGPDLMDHVLASSAITGLKHYFYGGKPGVAERLKAEFERRYPGVRIVGAGTPPFRPLSDEELRLAADEIVASGADVVWIGISTPKQEFLMADLEPMMSATMLGVGAAFDFHTGEVRRAPRWMQKVGFEWVYRLMKEPRRLWKRYLLMAPRFLLAIIKEAFVGQRYR